MRIGLVLLFWFLTASFAFSSPVDKITFITEEYPPYNYTKDGKLHGKNTKIIQKLFELTKSSKSVDDILVLPWAIGYEKALETPNIALFSTTRTKQREPLFKWVGPLSSHETVLLGHKDLLKKPIDISKLSIVVIHKDAGAQLLESLSIKPKQVITAEDNIEAAQMLYYGRVDAWAYGELTGKWILKTLGINPDNYQSIYSLGKKDLYLALNPKTDPKAIEALKEALAKIKSQEASK
jgi:polar amino acid transport system substrate-binding protein